MVKGRSGGMNKVRVGSCFSVMIDALYFKYCRRYVVYVVYSYLY